MTLEYQGRDYLVCDNSGRALHPGMLVNIVTRNNNEFFMVSHLTSREGRPCLIMKNSDNRFCQTAVFAIIRHMIVFEKIHICSGHIVTEFKSSPKKGYKYANQLYCINQI